MVVLRNGTYIDWETLEFAKKDIIVTENRTEFINSDNIPENTEIIDCSGQLITKSFANAHHHIYSALATGMPSPEVNPANFTEILKYVWWRLDKALDPDMIEASALATAVYSIRNGVSFIIDHHSSPSSVKGSLSVINRVLDKAGLAHLLCYEVSDRNGMKNVDESFDESVDYLSNNQALLGLHASFTLSDRSLKRAADIVGKFNTGIHIHVAEDKADQLDCIDNYGVRVIERLHNFNLLHSSKNILAHCIHLSESEKAMIGTSPSWVVQNPDSNLNNNVGFYSSFGDSSKIMLGTDGMHSNMIKSAQTAYFAGKRIDNPEVFDIYKRLRNVHYYIGENGFTGDNSNLIVLDYNSTTEVTKENFIGHLLFNGSEMKVRHHISQGKLIMKDFKILSIDEVEVLRFTKKQAKRLWHEYQNIN